MQQALKKKKTEWVKRMGVLFDHDNVKAHVTRVARDTIRRLGDTVSSTLSLGQYTNRLPSPNNHRRGKFFANNADLRQAFTYFVQKPDIYCQSGAQLKAYWQNFWYADRDYFND